MSDFETQTSNALGRLEEAVGALTKELKGNGRPGFIDKTNERLSSLERSEAKRQGAAGVIALVVSVGAQFIPKLWRH